jgi:hypothetical protein
MFDSLSFQDPRPIVLMKRAIMVLLAICLVTAVDSGYRAYVQVRSLEIHLKDSVLRSDSVIQTTVVCSGRTFVDVRLELVQGTHAETLAVQRVPGNDWASIDPRPQRASQNVVITPEVLARFRAGEARVRAIAIGRPQWLRLPPPTVRETTVTIERE